MSDSSARVASASVILGSLAGGELSVDEQELIKEIAPAGVTLFSRNIQSNEQLCALTSRLHQYFLLSPSRLPALIAIDQEGGRVARLKKPFPDQGPALYLAHGSWDSPAEAILRRYGGEVGQGLLQLGININFAPVVDVLQAQTHKSIGDRSFSHDPRGVSVRARAFLEGLQEQGVRGCLKHFPGQGGGCADTHYGAAVIDKSFPELNECDLVPFRDLIPHVSLVMLSHGIYTQLDPRPASLSSVIIEELLRGQLGFRGVAVSDDMTMAAIAGREVNFADQVVAAVESGIDLLLICKDIQRWWQAHQALCLHYRESGAFRKRLDQAAARVNQLRATLAVS